jgi:hypothetical protein
MWVLDTAHNEQQEKVAVDCSVGYQEKAEKNLDFIGSSSALRRRPWTPSLSLSKKRRVICI